MEKPTPTFASETKLREAYAALNRNDIPAFVNMFAPQIQWIEPVEFPSGGTYSGLEAVSAHLSQARETWAEGSCEPERFIVARDRIIVFDHVRVRLKHETQWREGRIAEVYTFSNAKAIEVRVFADRRAALEWAGAKVLDAN